MSPAVIAMLTELGSQALLHVIDLVADELKGRDDSTINEDADRIKEITARNK